jgi:hypothetical protein
MAERLSLKVRYGRKRWEEERDMWSGGEREREEPDGRMRGWEDGTQCEHGYSGKVGLVI